MCSPEHDIDDTIEEEDISSNDIFDSFENLKINDDSVSLNSCNTSIIMDQEKMLTDDVDETRKLLKCYDSGDNNNNQENYYDNKYNKSSKRSVKWNGQVNVIYYAGDTEKGNFLHEEREPLREESEQQLRRNRFIKLHAGKNFLA